MIDWPVPTSPTNLKSFLCLTGFYRKFIRGYAATAAPLTALLCRDKFKWSTEAQKAFNHLKSLMTQAPILASPDFTILFYLDTDASGTTIDAVLLQNSRPIAFFNKKFFSPHATSINLCPRVARNYYGGAQMAPLSSGSPLLHLD